MAGYNNYYPGYQPMYYPQQYQQPNPSPVQASQNQMTNSVTILPVSSDDEVTNYFVAPNYAVIFLNTTKPVLYLKQADSSGKATIKVYDERVAETEKAEDHKDYATKSELDTLREEIETLKRRIGKNVGKKEHVNEY